MRSRHIPMTFEEYELLPMEPGWKCEYWDGQAHLAPRYQSALTAIEIKPRPVSSPGQLRPVTQDDEAQLLPAYLAAFSDTIEYCDYEPEQIEALARQALHGFFAGDRGQPLMASRLAVAPPSAAGSKSIAGAALIVIKDDETPMLDLLFVAPDRQRRGLATALVSAAVNELHQLGEKRLMSRYHVGNDQSRAWHQQFGFVEEPDLMLARLYLAVASHELWRREKIGDLTLSEREALLSERERWRAQVDELEKVADAQGLEAVMPGLRYW